MKYTLQGINNTKIKLNLSCIYETLQSLIFINVTVFESGEHLES